MLIGGHAHACVVCSTQHTQAYQLAVQCAAGPAEQVWLHVSGKVVTVQQLLLICVMACAWCSPYVLGGEGPGLASVTVGLFLLLGY